MALFGDGIDDMYEKPVIQEKIIGFSGIDPAKKTNRSDVEEIISERLNIITEIIVN